MNKKINLLILNYEFPPLGGGASPVSYELTDELSKTGLYDIDVVTMGYNDLAKYEEINDNFRIHRVWCFRRKKEICEPFEQLSYLISGYFQCRKLFKKKKFDICHTHFIIPTGVLALWLKMWHKLPYVITAHGSDVLGYNPRFKKLYPLLKYPWRKVIDLSSVTTSPTLFLKGKILDCYKRNKDKIRVIPNGIKKDKFIAQEKKKYFLLVSRLTSNKGVQDVIEAAAKIDLKEYSIKIVGDGPILQDLQQMVTELHLQEKVEFLGWIDNKSEKMKEMYGHASIFILASYFENMNVTLMEAMQAKCAIISTNIGGNMELLGNNGLFFSPGNIDNLADTMQKIINNYDLVLEYGQKAQIRINSNFLWSNIINSYMDILR